MPPHDDDGSRGRAPSTRPSDFQTPEPDLPGMEIDLEETRLARLDAEGPPDTEGPPEAEGRSGADGTPATAEPAPSVPSPGLDPRPYLTAGGITLATLVVLVVGAGLPLLRVAEVGIIFLGLAAIVRLLDDGKGQLDTPLFRWLARRAEALEGRWGFEFYGLAGLTAFLRAEARTLTETEISVSEWLANPIGQSISWFISELIESIMNGIWASLWWLQLALVDFGPLGWSGFAGTILAAWAVWRVLPGADANDDG